MTGLDLVTASLRLIGAVAPGESLDATEASNALDALNQLLDSWSNEELLIPNETIDEFVLTPGTQVYTMGTGATINTARPIGGIDRANLKITTVTPNVEIPMHVLTDAQWARISVKTIQSNYPLCVWAEGTYPNETLHVYPNPTEANTLVLYSGKPLTQIASLSTVLSVPPGYVRALKYNLAMDLAPEYGKQTPSEVATIAVDAKAAVKRTNYRPRFLRVDRALQGGGGHFNWRTGDTT